MKKQTVPTTPTMQIEIKNLRLRTYVGIYDWEQKNKQDVNITVRIDCAAETLRACETDRIEDTLNYKILNKRIIAHVEQGRFGLLEKMAMGIADIVLGEDKAMRVRVRAEKPGALRFSDTVAIELCLEK